MLPFNYHQDDGKFFCLFVFLNPYRNVENIIAYLQKAQPERFVEDEEGIWLVMNIVQKLKRTQGDWNALKLSSIM